MQRFADDQDIDFDFVVLNTKQFNSGFTKSEFAKIEILFDSLSKPCVFGDVNNVLKADKSERENYIYIYCRRDETRVLNLNKLAIELGKVAINESTHDRLSEMCGRFQKNESDI